MRIKASNRLKVILLVTVLVVFFAILNLTGLSENLKNRVYFFSAPLQKDLWQTGQKISQLTKFLSDVKSLRKENESLKLRSQELLAEIISLKETKEENDHLRQVIGLNLPKEFKLIIAQPIFQSIFQEFILIDKGSKDGLIFGLPIITSSKALVGRVDDVSENFSKAVLITDKNMNFSVEVIDKKIKGVAKGKGNKIILDLVPQGQELVKGDNLITAGSDKTFPRGLLVGQIKEIKKDDIKPFQEVEISPFFETGQLVNLFIIIQ